MRSERGRFTARALAIAAGGIFAASAAAQTNWNSAVNGNWNDPARWTAGVPGPTTVANILQDANPYVVSLNDLSFTVGTLNLGNATTPSPNAFLDLTSGTLTVRNGYTQVSSMLIGNGPGGTGLLSILGPATLNQALLDSARVVTRGSLTFTGSAMNDICDTDMDHRGSVATWSGTGDLRIQGINGRFTNGFASTFTIGNNQTAESNGSGGGFVNNGRVVKTSSGLTTFLADLTVSNVGTFEAQGGTLQINALDAATYSGGTLSTGIWKATNATLDLGTNTITTNSADVSITGAGVLSALDPVATNTATGKLTFQNHNFNTAGAFTNSGAVSALGTSDVTVTGAFNSFSAGTLSPGTYNVQGRFLANFGGTNVSTLGARVTLDGASSVFGDTSAGNADRLSAVTTIQSTGELGITNGRNLTATGGALTVQSGGRVTVGPTSTMTLQGLTNLAAGTLTNGIYNVRGNLNLGSGADATTIAADVTLDGASASVNVAGNNVFDTFTTVASGGVLTLRGGQQLTTSGAVTVTSGALLNILGSGTRLTATGFTPAAGSTTTISGTLRFNGAAFTSVPSGVRVLPGGRVENEAGVDAFTALNSIPANTQFSVDSGETRTLLGNLTTDATGILTVGGGAAVGTMNIPGNYTQNGGTQLNSGALNVTGTYSLNGATTGGGTITAGQIIMGPGGSLGPGFSPGLVDITGDVRIETGADFSIEIGGPDLPENRGVLNDFIAIDGDVEHVGALTFGLGGTLRYSFINAFDPEIGDRFIIAHATGQVIGQFEEYVAFNSGIQAEGHWEGQDLVLTVTALPTPGVAALLGLAGLFASRRRR